MKTNLEPVHYCDQNRAILKGHNDTCSCEKNHINFFAEYNDLGKIVRSKPFIDTHYIEL